MRNKMFLGAFIICLLFWSGSTAFAANIDPDNESYQWAWGEPVGWVKPTIQAIETIGGFRYPSSVALRRVDAATTLRSES